MITNFKIYSTKLNSFVENKIFENNEIEPEVGDYVIMNDEKMDLLNCDKIRIEYFKTHIGKIINKDAEWAKISDSEVWCVVKFDKKLNGNDQFNFGLDDIEFFSKNKEEVEMYKASKKYNL